MSMPNLDKTQKGKFFTTENNPFILDVFGVWSAKSRITESKVIEPFAGSNSLINHLKDLGYVCDSMSYDINPEASSVTRRNTLKDFPQGYSVCVTNPPWLAKNRATLLGLDFPDCEYDDLYKFALDKCLANCEWVAALLPESFLRANIFRKRLTDFISLTSALFADTEHPVALCLFSPEYSSDVLVWQNNRKVGKLSSLEKHVPKPNPDGMKISFNSPNYNLGFIAVDNTYEDSIRFCEPSEVSEYPVKPTGRYITHIRTEKPVDIPKLNHIIAEVRQNTKDIFMTPYRGLRKDGKYRRRMDWSLARGIIHKAESM